MPATQQREKSSTEEAERFAMLFAGFDIGNDNEAEAMGKGRALRRMLAGKTLDDGKPLRLVDALELGEIRASLDAQLQPVRENAELKAAKLQNAELNEELKARYLQITEVAELAHRHEQTIEDLRRQLAGAASMGCVFSQAGPVDPAPAYLGGLLAFAGVMGGAALLFSGVSHLAVAALRWLAAP